jgi:hypothetical protein
MSVLLYLHPAKNIKKSEKGKQIIVFLENYMMNWLRWSVGPLVRNKNIISAVQRENFILPLFQ